MELNELFEKYSIETISNKTNIAIEKLKSLKELKFEDFREPQLIGFLKILQREFDVDIDDIKAMAKSYYQEHQNSKTVASIDLVDSEVSSSHEGYYITKFIYILTIAALAYAGWFYYNRETAPAIEQEENNSSVVSETISGVKNLLRMDAKKKLTLNNSSNSQNDNKEKNESNNSTITTNFNKKKKDSYENQTLNQEEQKEKFNIGDSNDLNAATNSSVSTSEINSIKKTVDILLEENESLKNAAKNRAKKEDNATLAGVGEANLSEANNTEFNSEENLTNENAVLEEAKIVSKAKALWVGIYNLDTKKRLTKIIRRNKEYNLNLNNGNYAIVTGHNKFNLVTNNETKTFPKRGKVYLLISKDEGVKILTKKEYRDITKRRAW